MKLSPIVKTKTLGVSSIDLHSMVNCELCEQRAIERLVTISKRMENDEEAVATDLATVDNEQAYHLLFRIVLVRE
jgi:hypothetical protein